MAKAKHYRVKQDTFLWDKGAIIEMGPDSSGYSAITDVFNKVDHTEYITAPIVEHKDNADYFERVYEVSVLGKMSFLTKEAAKKVSDSLFKGKTE